MSSTKAQRKARRREIAQQIAGLSDDELANLSNEIGREMNAQRLHIDTLRQRLSLVRAEMQRRKQTTDGGLRVSDHAVLRYLERVKGMDVVAVRKEIEALAIARGWTNEGGPYARRVDEETGIAFGVNGKTNVITTVLGKTEDAILDERLHQ